MAIKEREFDKLYNLVYDASGINLHKGKKELLKAKIAKRMRITKINSAQHYIKHLDENPDEFVEFIDTVTTNHTYFFRENTGCGYLVKIMAPEYVNTGKTLRIWCAASSTGEEPYSIAIQFLSAGYNINLLATDISHTVLSIAQKAVYRLDKGKNIPIELLHKYFQKGRNSKKNYIRVKNEIKRHISFQKFNLINGTTPNAMFDIIFCRNVLIYFDDITTETVVNKLYNSLKSGGYFLLGHSESLININHNFNPVIKVTGTYKK